MLFSCPICKKNIIATKKNLILCKHKKGFVHKDCCCTNCSMQGSPCEHKLSEHKGYRPLEMIKEVSDNLFILKEYQ